MFDHFKSDRNHAFYIAEIGGNHEGNFDYAVELCDLAIASGADGIKYQLYQGDSLVSAKFSPDRNKHFKKFELTTEQHLFLADRVRKAGCHYMASVWDEDMLAWIDPYIDIHKVGSGDLTHYGMLKALALTGKPIILSSGLSSFDEVQAAVDFIASVDAAYVQDKKLSVLQCTSAYPTPNAHANLRVVLTFRDRFDLPIGYSDHTFGDEAMKIAFSLGAGILEKHFTDTREGKNFRDHLISLTKDEVVDFLAALDDVAVLLGDAEKKLTQAEAEVDHHLSFRRSLYACKDIEKGAVFSEDNVVALRPVEGLCASRLYDVLGKKASRSISVDDPIRADDLL